jgi:O-antigen/teichoic acid export membrane protein
MGYLLLDKFLKAILFIFIWSKVFNFLGPQQSGVFSFASSLIVLVSVIANLSLGPVVIKRLVEGPEDKDGVMGGAFILQLIGTIFSVILLGMIMFILSLDLCTVLIVYCLSLKLIFQLFYNIDYYFQSQVLSKYVVISQSIAYGVNAVLCLLFIYFKMSVIYFALAVVIESAMIGVLLMYFYYQCGNKITSWSYQWGGVIGLAKEAWPIIFMCAAWVICEKIDQVMIKMILGDVPLGYYAAAVRICEVVYFIPAILVGSLFPAIVRSKALDNSVYIARVQSLSCLLFFLAVGVAIVLTLYSSAIISFLYGETFAPAASVLSLYAWAGIFIFLGFLSNKWAINENLQVYIMKYTFMGAGLNIILNFILIPAYSIQGAAFATLISYFMIFIVFNLFNQQTRLILKLQLSAMNPVPLIKRNIFIKALRGY